ncbi:MAG: hypothetical protein IJI36_12990 [Kiritimatiellae bacterium]|nr:hypothetical protein [Kiritimatiellia bacterium]
MTKRPWTMADEFPSSSRVRILAASACLAALATCSLAASETAYAWAGGDASLGNGAVVVSCDGSGNVTNVVASPAAGETIVLSGGDMTLAAGARITLSATGTLSFAMNVAAAGAVTLARGDDAYVVWTGAALTEPIPSDNTQWPLAFPGFKTDDLDFLRIVSTAGTPAAGRYDRVEGPEGNKFWTFNRVTASHVYSLRVDLQDRDEGIYARCRTGIRSPRFGLYAEAEEKDWETRNLFNYFLRKPIMADCGFYGYQTDTNTYGGVWVNRISTLGITKIIARRKGKGNGTAVIRFDGGASFGGTATIDAGVEAVIAVSEGDGAVTLANGVAGDGDIRFVSMPAISAYTGSTYLDGFISSTNWIVIGENRSLATLTSITGYMLGGSHNGNISSPSLCGTFFYRYDPATDTATVQFQFRRTYVPHDSIDTTKYVQAKLRQNGPNVEIAGVGYGYANPGVYGTEFPTRKVTTSDYTIEMWNARVAEFTDPSKGFVNNNYLTGYGICHVTATFGGESRRGYAIIAGDMTGLVGGRMSLESSGQPVWLTVKSVNGLPTGGEAVATSNTLLRLDTPLTSDAGISAGTTRLVARDGGVIHSVKHWQLRSTQDIALYDATLVVSGSAQFLDFITLSGGVISNTYPRSVMNQPLNNWRVIGTKPSVIQSGINIYGHADQSDYEWIIANGRSLHLDVHDVTGDDGVDLTVASLRGAADRTSDRERYAWFALEKRGAGTVLLTGDGKEVRHPATIARGTFMFGASGIMTNGFILAGGNVAAAAGTTNALGALTANAAGTISVGAGGMLAFESFSAGDGLTNGAVVVDAPLKGNVVRVGTSSAGLTAAQLAKFAWKDGEERYRVRIDNNGYIHPDRSGAVIILR